MAALTVDTPYAPPADAAMPVATALPVDDVQVAVALPVDGAAAAAAPAMAMALPVGGATPAAAVAMPVAGAAAMAMPVAGAAGGEAPAIIDWECAAGQWQDCSHSDRASARASMADLPQTPQGALDTPVLALDDPRLELGQGPFTVEAWICSSGLAGEDFRNPILSKHANGCGWELRMAPDPASGGFVPCLMVTVDKRHAVTRTGSGARRPLEARTWTHVAGVWTGQIALTYVNGRRVGKMAMGRRTPLVPCPGRPCLIGQNPCWQDRVLRNTAVHRVCVTPDALEPAAMRLLSVVEPDAAQLKPILSYGAGCCVLS